LEPRKRGRPTISISETKNPRAKLLQAKVLLTEWSGSDSETEQIINRLYELYHKNNKANIFQKMGASVCKFISQMPQLSPYRHALVQAISFNVRIAELELVLPLHRRSLSTAINLKINTLLTVKYKPAVTRKRVSDEERKIYEDLLLELCPIKSGENRHVKDPKTSMNIVISP
jgi:hypothetical protein